MRSIAVCLSLALFLLSAPVSANTDKLTADAPDAFIAQLRDVSVEQLTDRSIEAEVVPVAQRYGLAGLG